MNYYILTTLSKQLRFAGERIKCNLTPLSGLTFNIIPESSSLADFEPGKLCLGQQIRWRKTPKRKPIWMPMAKTKLFIIRKEPEKHPVEYPEIVRLEKEYKTKMRALINYFKSINRESSDLGKITIEKDRLEQKEFEKLILENNLENERIRIAREKRFDLKQLEEIAEIESKAKKYDLWLAEKKIEIEEIVRKEKELSVNFITGEKLASAIEECLDNPVNYNFAIDLEGDIFWEGSPHPTETGIWKTN